MSAEPSSTSESTLNNALGTLVLVAIPLGLVIMLGITGIAFVKGIPDRTDDASGAAPATVAVVQPGAPAPAPGAAVPAPGGGSGDAAPEGIDPAQFALGKKTFATCAACHGADGKGLKVGPTLMAPSLIGSETLLGDSDQPILVVLKGIKKETFDYMGVMAALGALPDDQIAAVLTYLRNFGGNSAPAITTEVVAAAREKFSDVNEPAGVPRAKIEEILAAHK